MLITERFASESRRDYALRMLKENIVSLEIKPGTMVSENELAAELGLSRGPVREALIELAKVKIVDVYPQRGSIIAPIDYDLVGEAIFMRKTLELAVVEQCCSTGLPPDQLAALQENLQLQRFYLETHKPNKLLALDNEFHRLLFFDAGVAQVYNLMTSMLVHLDRVRSMSLFTVKELKIVDDHNQILDAIVNRDAELAKEIMQKHLTRYKVDKEGIREHYSEYLK